MTKHPSSRKRQAIEVLTTVLAVVGAWFLPHQSTWVLTAIAIGLVLIFGLLWWRLRDR
jgi:hypothetical protein